MLHNNKDSENPIIVNSSKINYNYDINNFQGTIFATVGTGGAELHNFELKGSLHCNPEPWFWFPEFRAYNGIRLNSTFYDNNGTVSDHFIIDKLVNTQAN